MTDSRLVENLLFHKPYFGSAMWASQGVPKRHAYMQALVELLAGGKSRRKIKILEVGSWAGGSTITWAKALKKYFGDGQVVCVDRWQPYFDTKTNSAPIYKRMNEVVADGSIYRLFLHNIKASGLDDIVLPIVGDSRQILPTLKKEAFSIVYLDASHLYRDVAEDIKLSLALVENGGILCGDDLELQKSEVDAAELLQDVEAGKDYVRDKTRGVNYHPGVTMAVAEALGDVSSWEGFWAVCKTPEGWSRVDISGCRIEIPEHLSEAESESLKPVGTYKGFNIVPVGEIYYGLRQSLGEVDLTVGQEVLSRQYREEDVFSAFTMDGIRTHVDFLDFLKHVQQVTSALETVANKLTANQTQLDAHTKQLQMLSDLVEEQGKAFEMHIASLLSEHVSLAQQTTAHATENQRLNESLANKLTANQTQLDAHTKQLQMLSDLVEEQGKAFEMHIASLLSEHVSLLAKETARLNEEIHVIKSTFPLRMILWMKRLMKLA